MTVKLLIKNVSRNSVVTTNADIADTSQKRRTGLLKHDNLAAGEGLWIVPCEAVHTFGMKFPIDVLYLSRQKRVLKIRDNMRKSRMSLCLRAHSVLELPAGRAAETGTVVGDQLEFTKEAVNS
ncbi:MAG: DUF192 domain-containing protein [Acidobacteria bacterium]|nr:DUF192 domain-containing protein [Acidobacteriota bacterium]